MSLRCRESSRCGLEKLIHESKMIRNRRKHSYKFRISRLRRDESSARNYFIRCYYLSVNAGPSKKKRKKGIYFKLVLKTME
jgi:hypothetical protein